jgi:hypothetical protein
MAFQAQLVQPGDLITADLMNQLMSAVTSLELRVAALETGVGASVQSPILIGRDPQGDVEVGSKLTLIGANFLQPADQNTVVLGNAAIKQFLVGSDDAHLILQVPDLFPNLPQTLPVIVTNRNGSSAQLAVRVLPHQETQGGQVVFRPQSTGAQTAQVGQPFQLQWDVDSQTNIPENYALSVVYSNAAGASQSAWQQATTITPSGTQRIARGAPLRVTVGVTVPAGAQSVDIALRAAAQDHPAFSKTSDSVHVTVGQVVVTSDPKTTMNREKVTPLTDQNVKNPAREATIDGASGVEVKLGQEGYLLVDAHFSVLGQYRFSTEVENGGSAWSARVDPASSSQGAGTDVQLAVHVTNNESAPGPPRFMVVRAAKRNSANTADEFVSFVRFPVRGYAA